MEDSPLSTRRTWRCGELWRGTSRGSERLLSAATLVMRCRPASSVSAVRRHPGRSRPSRTPSVFTCASASRARSPVASRPHCDTRENVQDETAGGTGRVDAVPTERRGNRDEKKRSTKSPSSRTLRVGRSSFSTSRPDARPLSSIESAD
jgi:hypothetical protein